MDIIGNGTLLNYSIISWDEFLNSGFTTDYGIYYSYFQPYSNFAIFNIELIANTTLVLNTISNLTFNLDMVRFDYHYIVGSARTFEGHTLEQVHINLVEEVPFLSKSFYPDEHLELSENGIVTDAVWDFNITEFSSNTVGLTAMVRQQTTPLIDFITSAGIVAFIVFIVYQFGYKKSKSFSTG